MRKLSVLIIALMTVCFINATSTLYFGELKIKAGETKTIELNLQNDSRLKGIELVLALPTGLSFVYDTEEEDYIVGGRCSYLSSNLRTNGSLKIAGAAQKAKEYVAIGDGALFSFAVKAADNVTLGDGNITISEVEIVTEAGTENPDASQFPIKIYQEYTITATSADETMGSVTGGGTYESGVSATLAATPVEGYHFVKWSDDATDNPYTFTVTADKSLTATFAPNQYTITFDSNGGSAVVDLTADYKSAITAPANPTRTGYTFAGWNPAFPETMPLNGATLTAQWTPILYTLTYNLAGGAVATANPIEYTIESEDIILNNPTREGYTFAGWTGTDLTEAIQTVTIAKGSIGNREYTATWTPVVYAITYDLAGGAVATDNPATYTIETADFTLTNPTREGYTFAGWTGTDISEATQAVTIAKGSMGNRSYVATWTPILYTLTYNLAGGEVATANPTEYTIESEDIILNNPTREGYTFAGWTGTDLTEATQTVTIAKGSIGNREYTATWTPIVYSITYELAGGVVATANPTEYTIESEAITLNNPTREGYTFAGWIGTDLTEATATVTIAKGSIGNCVYTATWTPIVYSIAYELAGGTVATANPTEYTIESEAITLNNPTREGYTFAGWIGTDLTEAAATVTIVKGSMGNRSYTATWTVNQYTMTFKFGGNGQENVVLMQDYGTALTAPEVNAWTGHTFKAWSPEVPATVPAEDMTFTAQWDVNKYKLTFKVDGEIYSQTDVEYGAAIVVPENPTKTGYTFTAWDAAIPETMPAEDLTFNAQFTINQYKMTFKFGGNSQEDVVLTQDYGTSLTAPEVNAWTGHTFKAWSPEVPATVPAEDMTFTAQWDVNKYKATFKVDGEVYKEFEFAYGAAVTAPANPTKEGYTFTAWDPALPETMPAEDLTFNAQFTINTYNVIYIVKGQEWARDEVVYGAEIVLRGAPELEAGEEFLGWESDAEYTTMPAHDVTYTAKINVLQGIVKVFRDEKSADVYSTTGTLVGRQLTIAEVLKLPKGLYIINGQKVMIK